MTGFIEQRLLNHNRKRPTVINTNELARKTVHLANSVIPLFYFFLIPDRWIMGGILVVCAMIALYLDWARTRVGWVKTIYHRYIDFMLRPHELEGAFTGASWVFLGSLVVVLIFPMKIAVLALLFMSVGDTVAALVGMQFGKIRLWNKTLEGSVMGILSCLLLSLLFPGVSWWVRVGGALAAMFVELIPIPIDDNFRIPVLSGLFMMVIQTLLV